ncbi:MAG: hypothetical protein K2P94_01755 [Rhodospirillaceae bacterium]|nr:hypothetical protein [Rhodospirillaceae bacterium]
MKKLLFLTGALLLATPVNAVLARDDNYNWPGGQHQRDHREHEGLHEDIGDAHQDAHAEGFWSRREHRGWHRAAGALHEEFHEDVPNTRHDHWDGYNRGTGYQPSYGYYNSIPSYGFTWSFGR